MDPDKILMARGGEKLDEVMRREEEEELPKFEEGSFVIDSGEGSGERIVGEEALDDVVPRGAVHMHTMRDLIRSIRAVGSGQLQCSQVCRSAFLLGIF